MKWMRVSSLLLTGAVLSVAWSCSSSTPSDGFAGGTTQDASSASSSGGGHEGGISTGDGGGYVGFGDGSTQEPDGSGGTGCVNLQCQVHSCGSGDGGGGDAGGTTVTGTVYDPAGRNPIYNVVVYVPNATNGALDPIPIGVNSDSCSCGALFSGEPIAVTSTDTSGNFTLTNVPDGANIPLVVQIGKWRKEIILPSVQQCGTTSAGKITLPKNLSDGKYASIPNIAVSTGGADTLECLLTRIGVDEAFFTGTATGPGVHVFQGIGGNAAKGSTKSAATLWDSQDDLMRYDILMLSCEGNPTGGVTATTAGYLAPYVSAGGRVFAEHFHYAFFTSYNTTSGTAFPQFANVADWTHLGVNSTTDAPYNNDITGVIESTLPNGSAFPEGVALKSWLGTVGALTNGEITVPVANARDTATVTAANVSTPWVQTDPSISPASSQYFSWDMPFNPPVSDAGVPEYCGRVVYSDMHVSGSANDYPAGIGVVPTGCDSTSALSPDEDAIEFILFDLSSCLTPVGFTPKPPQPEAGIAQ